MSDPKPEKRDQEPRYPFRAPSKVLENRRAELARAMGELLLRVTDATRDVAEVHMKVLECGMAASPHHVEVIVTTRHRPKFQYALPINFLSLVEVRSIGWIADEINREFRVRWREAVEEKRRRENGTHG